MAIYYSKSANAFFVDGVNATIPADKAVVSQDAWQHLLANQSPTSVIAADGQGNPVLVNPSSNNAVVYTSVGVT